MKRQSHVTIIVSDGRTDEAPVAEAVVDTAEE
jgi:hypothetical protein